MALSWCPKVLVCVCASLLRALASVEDGRLEKPCHSALGLNIPKGCLIGGANEVAPLGGVGDAVLGRADVAVEATLPCVFRLSRAFDLSRRASLQLTHIFLKLPAMAVFCALD